MDTKTLRDEYSALHAETEKVIEAAVSEGRELKADEKEANERRYARLEQLKSLFDEQTKFAKFAFESGKVQLPQEAPGKAAVLENRGDEPKSFNKEQFAKALNTWKHTGQMDRQFATITTATGSGIMLPRSIATPIFPSAQNVFRQAHDLLGVPVLYTDGTSDWNQPIIELGAGASVAENASSETENAHDVTKGFALNATTYQSGSVWFSNKQLKAVDFDIVSQLVPELYNSVEDGVESAIAANIIANGSLDEYQIDSASGWGWDDINGMVNDVFTRKYDSMKFIVLSRTAYSLLSASTDLNGQPLMINDTQLKSVKTVMGVPVLRSDYFEAQVPSNVIGCVVSLKGFKLRDASQDELHRYDSVPTKPGQTGFNLVAFRGFGYSTSAVVKIVTGGS